MVRDVSWPNTLQSLGKWWAGEITGAGLENISSIYLASRWLRATLMEHGESGKTERNNRRIDFVVENERPSATSSKTYGMKPKSCIQIFAGNSSYGFFQPVWKLSKKRSSFRLTEIHKHIRIFLRQIRWGWRISPLFGWNISESWSWMTARRELINNASSGS